jgi:hypothetical protein
MEAVVGEVVEAVVGRVLVVRDLAERDDLVTQFLEVRRPFLQLGARLGVVRFRTVAGRHEAGEQRRAARRAARRGDVGAREGHPRVREPLHVRRADALAAVGRGVELALVISEEDDEVRARGGGDIQRKDAEDAEERRQREQKPGMRGGGGTETGAWHG